MPPIHQCIDRKNYLLLKWSMKFIFPKRFPVALASWPAINCIKLFYV